MSTRSKIVMLIEAKGAAKTAAQIDKVDGSIKKVDRSSKAVNKSSATTASRFKKVGKAASIGAAAVAGAAVVYAKQAVGATVGLAKSTMGLSRSLGFTTERASQWAAVAKSRDMDPSKLQQGFTKVASSVKNALDGSKGAAAGFKELGVSQDDLQKGTKNFDYLLARVGDGFKNLKGGVDHAALAQKLLGKSGKDLLPILRGGSKGIEEQLALAKKYGAVIDDGTAGGAKKYIETQREMKMAQLGMQISLTKNLLPALLKILPLIPKLMNFFQKNAGVLKPLIVTIGALAAAQWLLNIALAANPVIAVVAGFALLAGALILAYKNITWFRNGVNAVFKFVKKNWKLILIGLVAPVALAVILIRRHFGKIVGFAKSLPGRMTRAFSGMWDGLKNTFKGAINWIIKKWNSFQLSIGPIKIPAAPDIPKISVNTPNIPMLAQGGQVHGVGSRWVSGEGGAPELGEVTADGVKITPLAGDSGVGPSAVIQLQVNLDGRKVGEGVRRVALRDMLAASPA